MKKIFKNIALDTMIFAVGNGSALLISFFMIPLYTSILSKAAFGMSDIINTTVSMLLPVISLNVFTAVFRWGLDVEKDKTSLFSNGLFITSIGTAAAISVGIVSVVVRSKYIWAIAFVVSGLILVNFFQNFYRGVGKIKLYAASGVIGSVSSALLNVILMVVFKFGLLGYLLSMILSNYIIVLFLIIFGNAVSYWDKKRLSKTEMLEMLRFSVPMIPNAFAWWMTNDICRVLILIFVGPSGNGLYAVANKLPSMMFTVFSLFQNAWQVSSVKVSKEGQAKEIYYLIFNSILMFMIFISTIIVAVIKVFMKYYVAPAYFQAWEFVPLLLLTAVFSNISVFLGTSYLVSKQTKGLLTTTIWGTGMNLMLGLLLIPIIGVQGATISGCVGFCIVSIMRLKDTKKWVKIKVEWSCCLLMMVGYIAICVNEYICNGNIQVKITIISIMACVIIIKLRSLKKRYF